MKRIILIGLSSLLLLFSGIVSAATNHKNILVIACPDMAALKRVELNPKNIKGNKQTFWLVGSTVPFYIKQKAYYPVVKVAGTAAKTSRQAYKVAKKLLKRTKSKAALAHIIVKDVKFAACFYSNSAVSAWTDKSPSLKRYQFIMSNRK